VIELRKRPGNDMTLPFRIAAWARRLRLDILHARGWPTLVETVVGGYFGGVRRTAYAFHGKTVADLQRKGARRRAAEIMIPRLYSQIVTLTDSMRADVVRECRLASSRVRVIPNGVDVEVFRPMSRRRSLRVEFGLPPEGLIVGNVARLDPVKNHSVLLRALVRLQSTGVEPFLLLVGEGSERHRLEHEIHEHGLGSRVHLLGHSDRVPELLNCMDIYVQASLYEGFSNTVLEAMACGLPVIATRTGGTVDLMSDGQEGFLFEPADDHGLASRILELVVPEKRCAMGSKGRERATAIFPLTRMIREYERLYRDLASSRASARRERTAEPIGRGGPTA
jgi:glycosyltransferase involved in cell wall biosynthesis